MSEAVYVFIDDEKRFGTFRYSDTDVVVMMANDYVNITQFCIDLKGKPFDIDYWKAHGFTKAASDHLGTPFNDMFIEIESDNDRVSGVYVHNNFLFWVGSWASHSFAYNFAGVANKAIAEEAREQDAEIRRLDNEIRKRNAQIKKLEKKARRLRAKRGE